MKARPVTSPPDEAAAANMRPPREQIDDTLLDNRGTALEARQRPVRAAKVAANAKLQTR